MKSMMAYILMSFVGVSNTFHLPQGLLSATCYVESKHYTQAVNYHDGGSKSLGICQVKLATARQLGFTGAENELREPKTNIYWAGAYLSYQLTRYHGDIIKALSAYNRGSYSQDWKGRPVNNRYVDKVLSAWKKDK